MAIDLKGLLYRALGKYKGAKEEAQDGAGEALLDVQHKLLARDRTARLRCAQGHPLFKGQREEDCFDCYLLSVARLEQTRARPVQEQRVLAGALLCLKGFHEGAVFPLRLVEDVPLTIGSDPECDIVLSDEHISRRHLMIAQRQGRTIVRDLNSLRHSALRAAQEMQWYVLDPEREYWCEDGAHLVLAEVELLYRANDAQALRLGGDPLASLPSDGRLENRSDQAPALAAPRGE